MSPKLWFTPIGTPVRGNNFVQPLVDGEETWSRVFNQLRAAKKTIHMTFWMMALDFELRRDAAKTFKNPADRYEETIRKILLDKKNRDGVAVRILLWEMPTATAPITPLYQDIDLRRYGQAGVFEVMYEQHPSSLIGSWHQKTIIVDGEVAFVGGMNTKENDWDTTAHTLYDYRRTPHASTASERTNWRDTKSIPKYPPRHDFMMQIIGPLAADVEANFVERWNTAKAAGVLFSAHATTLPKPKTAAGFSNVTGQIARTMPAKYPPTPAGEQGILDLYVKAVRNAETYIYIEDQYFRSQVLAKELAIAVGKNKKLILIVVTPPDYLSELEADEFWKVASLPPSSYWTAAAYNTIKAVAKDFTLFYLQVSDTDRNGKQIFTPINLHAKIMIIDDVWYTIGSCNVNDRGFQYEGEMNVAVFHESAKDLRRKLFAEHLGVPCPEDVRAASKLWYEHAAENHEAFKDKTKPKSRVFPFAQAGPLFTPFPKDWF